MRARRRKGKKARVAREDGACRFSASLENIMPPGADLKKEAPEEQEAQD
jgi:hypothetical protein